MFQIIQLAIAGFSAAADLVQKLRARAKQTGELTPEQEKELDDRINEVTNQDHWKIQN